MVVWSSIWFATGLNVLHERVSDRFVRAEPRARVREYVLGPVAGLERKNGWMLAERAGEVAPDGMQRLLRRADWDIDGVRDDVRAYLIERLGGCEGVLIVHDAGLLNKGTRSAGVQRQYSGTAGRIENCQIGVFLAYASTAGLALIDRELTCPSPGLLMGPVSGGRSRRSISDPPRSPTTSATARADPSLLDLALVFVSQDQMHE
jgi:SRSO17 transposase